MSVGLTFEYEPHSLADLVLKTRAVRALDSAATRYPIHRDIRCAARRKLEDVFDDLALEFGYPALRLDEGTLLLDGPDAFIQASGWRKAERFCARYSSAAKVPALLRSMELVADRSQRVRNRARRGRRGPNALIDSCAQAHA